MIILIPKPPTLISPSITSLNIGNHHSCFASIFTSPSRFNSVRRRRRFQPQASSLVLPLLPFPADQVLVPSEVKSLHLYEARYIALLEESLLQKNKLFVHFVFDPVGLSVTSVEASFAAKYGCLATIEKVERLEIGALVLVRGVGRVKVLEFKQNDECKDLVGQVRLSAIGFLGLQFFLLRKIDLHPKEEMKRQIHSTSAQLQAQPYLTGEVTSLQDNVLHKMTEISSKVLELKEALHSLNSLEIKLKAPGIVSLQTQTTNSLFWAEKQPALDCNADFIPSEAERVSFAAFQPISGASQSELVKLQREKMVAMDATDTLERLKRSIQLAKDNISILAAKLAIQSLGMQ